MSGWLVTWRDYVLLAGSEQLEQMGDVLLVAVINLGIVPPFRTAGGGHGRRNPTNQYRASEARFTLSVCQNPTLNILAICVRSVWVYAVLLDLVIGHIENRNSNGC